MMVPLTEMSRRTGKLRTGCPLLSSAITTICDCDDPSCRSVSGFALSEIAVASSEGPDSGGACCFLTVQPARHVAATASAASARMVRVISMPMQGVSPRVKNPALFGVAPIANVTTSTGHRNVVAVLVSPVERDLRDGRDENGPPPLRRA